MKLNNPYVIVGRCLSPTLSEADRAELVDVLDRTVVPWKMLLATANMHRCTPLWYVRLHEHGLLDLVPEDLRDYLTALHAANTERNGRIRAELVQIVSWFNEARIPVLLLKGAATFVDELYKDPGARLMQDLDLLVPETEVFRAKRLLMERGYVEHRPDRIGVRNGRIVSLGHHLTPIEHPVSKLKIELHYRVMYCIGAQVLPAQRAWETAMNSNLNKFPVKILAPTDRILHTVLHATLAGKDFNRSRVFLSDMAEFASLAEKEKGHIDESCFWRLVGEQGFNPEAAVFVGLVRAVLQSNFQVPYTFFGKLYMSRVIKSSQSNKLFSYSKESQPSFLWPLLQSSNYYLSMLKWVWRMLTLVLKNARQEGFLIYVFNYMVNRN